MLGKETWWHSLLPSGKTVCLVFPFSDPYFPLLSFKMKVLWVIQKQDLMTNEVFLSSTQINFPSQTCILFPPHPLHTHTNTLYCNCSNGIITDINDLDDIKYLNLESLRYHIPGGLKSMKSGVERSQMGPYPHTVCFKKNITGSLSTTLQSSQFSHNSPRNQFGDLW